MLKIFLAFALVLGVAAHVMAVEVDIVPYDEAEENQSNAYVISFDGKNEANHDVIDKILACHNKFNAENKQHLDELLEGRGGVAELKSRHKHRSPASKEVITLSNRELNESFVKGALKDCLSKK